MNVCVCVCVCVLVLDGISILVTDIDINPLPSILYSNFKPIDIPIIRITSKSNTNSCITKLVILKLLTEAEKF